MGASAFGSVELVKVNLASIRPVKETISAFREVSSAQEDKERIIVNAQRLLVSLTPQAHGNADYEVKQADGEAYRRVKGAGAEADALRRVSQAVQSAPEVLQNMLWREKLEIALSHNSKIIVPRKGQSGQGRALEEEVAGDASWSPHAQGAGAAATAKMKPMAGKTGRTARAAANRKNREAARATAVQTAKSKPAAVNGASGVSAGGAAHGAQMPGERKERRSRPVGKTGRQSDPWRKERGEREER